LRARNEARLTISAHFVRAKEVRHRELPATAGRGLQYTILDAGPSCTVGSACALRGEGTKAGRFQRSRRWSTRPPGTCPLRLEKRLVEELERIATRDLTILNGVAADRLGPPRYEAGGPENAKRWAQLLDRVLEQGGTTITMKLKHNETGEKEAGDPISAHKAP